MLINAGADVDLLDMHGRHPLHLAKSKLFMLQRYLSEGCMEMAKFKTEVKEVRLFVVIFLPVFFSSNFLQPFIYYLRNHLNLSFYISD